MGNVSSSDGAEKAKQVSTLSTGALVHQPVNMKMVEDDLLIWLDGNINENSRDYRNTVTQLQCTVNAIGTFTDSDQCIQFIETINSGLKLKVSSQRLHRSVKP
jgi:hypothetical protein